MAANIIPLTTDKTTLRSILSNKKAIFIYTPNGIVEFNNPVEAWHVGESEGNQTLVGNVDNMLNIIDGLIQDSF